MKVKISKEAFEHVLQGVDEMIMWYHLKLDSLEPPTKDDSIYTTLTKFLELHLLGHYAESMINTHNLLIALAHNSGIINLEKENEEDD